jgi:hypothetical protein
MELNTPIPLVPGIAWTDYPFKFKFNGFPVVVSIE